MVKRAEHNIAAKTSQGVAMQHTIEYDDALIPSADEMEKYQKIDPDFVTWFMDAGRKEQEHRHQSYDKRYEILQRAFSMDRLVAILYFVVVLSFLIITAILLVNGIELAGSIFGIFGIIGFIFMSKRYFLNNSNNQE